MKQGKKTFLHESVQDADTIRSILDAISKGMGKGKLEFSDEDDDIRLTPQGLMHLKISASQEGHQHRFNIRVNWQTESEQLKNKSFKVK